MYVFHGNLEAVEAAGFGDLNFLAKALHLAARWRSAPARPGGPHLGPSPQARQGPARTATRAQPLQLTRPSEPQGDPKVTGSNCKVS